MDLDTRQSLRRKIFLSWSGMRSRMLAEALRKRLPEIFAEFTIFVSSIDGEPGLWMENLMRTIDSSDIGVLCLTPENLHSSFMHFEAGAIARQTNMLNVFPFTYDLRPDHLVHPFTAFNGYSVTREGTRQLVLKLSEYLGPSRDPERLSREFDDWFESFESELKAIPCNPPLEDYQRLLNPSSFINPDLFARFAYQETRKIKKRESNLLQGYLRIYGSEIERFEGDLFNYLYDEGIRKVDGVDLITDPKVTITRVKRRLARKRFVTRGGTLRRILVVHERDLLIKDFRETLCAHIREQEEDGISVGLLMMEHLNSIVPEDFILYYDFAVMVEQRQANSTYSDGVSVLHFQKLEVQEYTEKFEKLWKLNATPNQERPLAVRLADLFVQRCQLWPPDDEGSIAFLAKIVERATE